MKEIVMELMRCHWIVQHEDPLSLCHKTLFSEKYLFAESDLFPHSRIFVSKFLLGKILSLLFISTWKKWKGKSIFGCRQYFVRRRIHCLKELYITMSTSYQQAESAVQSSNQMLPLFLTAIKFWKEIWLYCVIFFSITFFYAQKCVSDGCASSFWDKKDCNKCEWISSIPFLVLGNQIYISPWWEFSIKCEQYHRLPTVTVRVLRIYNSIVKSRESFAPRHRAAQGTGRTQW